MRAAAHLIVALEELERELATEASDPSFSTPHATIGIGPIHGGVALNIVPDRCTLQVEARVLPGQPLDAIVERIGAVASAGDGDRGAPRRRGYPPLTPTADWRSARASRAIAGHGDGGAVDFGTEAGLYQERLGVPVVVCGPGSMTQGHTPDEFITADQLAAGEAFIDRLLDAASWLRRGGQRSALRGGARARRAPARRPRSRR